MGYTHRDIKPDNWLLDRRGHLAVSSSSYDTHVSSSSYDAHVSSSSYDTLTYYQT